MGVRTDCCPICYRATGERVTGRSRAGVVEEGEAEVTEQKFCRLLERYLSNGEGANDGGRSGGNEATFSLEQLIGRGSLRSCGECLDLMEGFCRKYHQLKVIELELNWKVERLRTVMKAAQRVPSRVRHFREVMGTVDREGKAKVPRRDAQEVTEMVMKSKKRLIELCSRKLQNGFPKLPIVKWRRPKQEEEGDPQPEQVMSQVPKTSPGRKGGHTRRSKRKVPMADPDSDNDDLGSGGAAAKQPCFGSEEGAMDCIPPLMDEEPADNDQVPDECAEILSQLMPISKVEPPKVPGGDTFEHEDSHPELACQQSEPPESRAAHSEEGRGGASSNSITSTTKHTKTPPGRRSGLRSSTHSCPHCRKKFSSEERLQSHVQIKHKEEDDNGSESDQSGEGPLSTDNEDGDLTDADDDGRIKVVGDNMLHASLSLDEEFEMEHDSFGQEGDAMEPLEIQNPEHVSSTSSKKGCPDKDRNVRKRRQLFSSSKSPAPKNLLFFRCPDCDNSFGSMGALLIHRRDSNSCKKFYDPLSNVKVQVCVLSKDEIAKKSKSSDPSKMVNFALIDLPPSIFSCDEMDCDGSVFFSPGGLQAHKRLHGSFPCKFCQVEESYAPNLALHEYLEHSPSMKKKKRKEKRGHHSRIYDCPRCDFQIWETTGPKTFIRHHLKHHLDLVFYEPVCAICPDKTSLVPVGPELKRHIKTHHDLTNAAPEDVKKCQRNNCKAYFLDSQQLKVHQFKCNKDQGTAPGFRLKCPDCSLLFESANKLLLHRKDSMSCGASYDPKTSIRVEVFTPPPSSAEDKKDGKMGDSQFTNRLAIIDLPQAIFTCDVCKTIAYSLPDLEAHEKLHCNFPCDSCDEVITFAPEIPLHDLQHSALNFQSYEQKQPSGIQCPCCDFKCSPGEGGRKAYVHHYLGQHLSLTWNEPKCPICNTNPSVYNKSEFNFGEHCKRYHDLTNATTPESLKRCTVANCPSYFLTTAKLQLHLKMRHGILPATEKEKDQKCKDCDKRFSTNKELLTHRLKCHVESGAAIPCVFDTCPKVFESKEDMHRHIIGSRTVHKPLDDPSKEVQCPKCEASFSGSDPNLLVQHLKAQHHNRDTSKKRKFVCEPCGKSFRDKTQLQVHSRTHTKDKPFECEVCGMKFGYRQSLKLHVNKKHGDKDEHVPAKKKPKNGKAKVTPKKKSSKKKVELEDVEVE